MAKEKIQGWTDPLGCFQEGKKPEEIYCSFDAATLVVHDSDKHERVFTESEVRELLRRCSNEATEYAGRYVSFNRLLDTA